MTQIETSGRTADRRPPRAVGQKFVPPHGAGAGVLFGATASASKLGLPKARVTFQSRWPRCAGVWRGYEIAAGLGGRLLIAAVLWIHQAAADPAPAYRNREADRISPRRAHNGLTNAILLADLGRRGQVIHGRQNICEIAKKLPRQQWAERAVGGYDLR